MNQGGSTPTYCTVTFDIENGQHASEAITTFENPSDATRQVEAGQQVGTLPTLSYNSSAYGLDGWYITPQHVNNEQIVTDQTVITNDTTFYARFFLRGGGIN